MKKTALTAAVITAAVLVAGCSEMKRGFEDGSQGRPLTFHEEVEGDEPARVGDTVIPPAPPAERKLADDEDLLYEAYMYTMTTGAGIPATMARSMYENEIPATICDALDAGASFADVVMVGVTEGGLTAEQSGYTVGVSIGGWCPENEWVLPE